MTAREAALPASTCSCLGGMNHPCKCGASEETLKRCPNPQGCRVDGVFEDCVWCNDPSRREEVLGERKLRVVSLFAGIGGVDLGLERAGMEIVAHAEIEPVACRTLARHWPGVPNLGDVTTVDWAPWVGKVDVVTGGFPCQDVSVLGHKAGIKEGTRSGLYFEFVRAIRALRPRYVIVENVAALVARGLDIVLAELAALGFDAEWSVLSACALGAPHPRERLFLVAYPHAEHGSQGLGDLAQLRRPSGQPGTDAAGPWPDALVGYVQANAGSAGVVDGVPDRLDRAAACGNAVVPQVAELVGQMVVAHHARREAVAA